jgi:membrane-associated phospholipid phosphatase
VAGPAAADRALLGGVPSAWLQSRLVDGSAHWWDALAALVYVTHFVSVPLVTGLVWFRLRDRFRAWLAAVVAFTVVGIGGYVLYPAAPPWLASRLGEVAPVARISNLGWEFLHLDLVATISGTGQQGSNPVAAMPSLHAGAALLVTLFLWRAAGSRWRAALVAYVLAMAVTLVYTGEHYVVDVLAGWLTAGVAVAGGRGLHHRRDRGSTRAPAPLRAGGVGTGLRPPPPDAPRSRDAHPVRHVHAGDRGDAARRRGAPR